MQQIMDLYTKISGRYSGRKNDFRIRVGWKGSCSCTLAKMAFGNGMGFEIYHDVDAT